MRLAKACFILFSFTTHLATSAQSVNFTIKGKINNTSAKKVYLQGSVNESIELDDQHRFSFNGTLPETGVVLVKADNSYAWGIWVGGGNIEVMLEEFFAEGTDTTGKRLIKVTSIRGSAETEKNQWFMDQWNKLSRKYSALPAGIRRDSIGNHYYPLLHTYITNHPRSALSAHLISQANIDADKKNELLKLLNRDVNTEEAKSIEAAIKRETLLKQGAQIEPFQQPTPAGKLFSSYDLTAKYTLLEFWSSDCLPCRAANPGLVELYNRYHTKGFEIVGISLDVSRSEWEKAIKKDALPWINVSDLKGWDNAIAKKYFIDAIPFNILIDRDKKIIATDLTHEDLAGRLKELLGD